MCADSLSINMDLTLQFLRGGFSGERVRVGLGRQCKGADTMEIKSAGCLIGVLVTLLSICFSQPIIPNYYYSGKLAIFLFTPH